MKLADVLCKECIVVNSQSSNKTEVLKEIAKIAKKSEILEKVDENDIFKALEAREALSTTGVGNNIAIPHCRMKAVTDFVVGVITVPSGVDFNSIDGQIVKIIVFIIAPEVESNKHVRLLSAVSQVLLAPKTIDNVLAETVPEGIYKQLIGSKDVEVNGKEQIEKSLIHIIVQNEDIFHEIIHAMAGVDSISISIIGAENSSVYLSKLPLFASFWTDEPSDFSRIIVAVVNKSLTNETIRCIESVTGDMNKRNDIMVTVQPVQYAAGTLST